MRLARPFKACAAAAVYIAATALMPVATANAATCSGSTYVQLTTTPDSACGGAGDGIGITGGIGDVVLNTDPSYFALLGTHFFKPITSGSFSFDPQGFTNFVIGFEGYEGNSENPGWNYFWLPAAVTSGTFKLFSSVDGSAITDLIIYADPTPLPSSIMLFATVLAGAWGIWRWRRRHSNLLAAA